MQRNVRPALARRLLASFCLCIAATSLIAVPHAVAAPALSEAHETPPDQIARTIAARKAGGGEFHTFTLLRAQTTAVSKRADVSALVSDGTLLSVDEAAVKSLLSRHPQQFTLPIPGQGELELVRVNYDDLIVEGPGGDDLSWTNTAQHYQGTLKGGARSVAAISVFRNLETGAYEISGVYGTGNDGNTVIGRLKGRNAANDHLVYRESALRAKSVSAVECGMDEVQHRMVEPSQTCPVEPEAHKPGRARSKTANEVAAAGDCVRIHLEVENDVYRTHGANTTNYATGFFNIAKSVYANENIPIKLHYLKVWTTPDPEASISYYYDIWNAFWNRKSREGIEGDLAILVGFHIDRGVASLNTICGPDYNQTGISPIRDYPSYPTYSWAGATLPHEIGHLFGSQHTQSCAWNGNNTALDGCVAPEGSCARPASRYGTIMSYCSDFSLAQGFGTQPGNLIRNSFANATCLDCGTGGCTSSISPTSANVGAAAASGTVAVTTSASTCTWTAASGASWITITSGGGPFTGNGSVAYSVAANTGTAARSGTLTIAGQAFTVTQQASTSSTALANGVAVGVSGAAGSTRAFYIDVPNGATNLVIATSGGTGDLDLYTKFGTPPTTTAYDCRPYANNNTESCSVAAPTAGRYHVLLQGYSAYSGASLRASFSVPATTTVDLTAPAGGEVWTRGSTRQIRWTTTNSQHVDVALYKGSAFVQWITWNAVSSTGAYNWTIPSTLTAGSDYRVTLIDYDQRAITDSSGAFTIN